MPGAGIKPGLPASLGGGNMTVQDLFNLTRTLIQQGKGNIPIYFDTEARKFDYHLAKVGSGSVEQTPEPRLCLFEAPHAEVSAISKQALTPRVVLENAARDANNLSEVYIVGICKNKETELWTTGDLQGLTYATLALQDLALKYFNGNVESELSPEPPKVS
jgi:hypothetical protein